MGIAIAEEHRELAAVVRSFVESHGVREAARAALDLSEEELPGFWSEMASLGWLGLHLPERYGGSGFGLTEIAVVVEELGRVPAPGPLLPSVISSAVIAATAGPTLAAELLPGLADGSRVAGLGLGGSLELTDGLAEGDAGIVLGAQVADLLLLAVGEALIVVHRDAPGVKIEPSASLDLGRRTGQVHLSGCPISEHHVLAGGYRHALQIGRALAATEAAGGASACTEATADYARSRIAFGRPIGQFQAVKHHCANMLAQSELATAAAWDALRALGESAEAELSTAVAATVALPAYLFSARVSASRSTEALASRGSTTPTSSFAGRCR